MDCISCFQDNSSLRSIIEKPPIVGKELLPLTPVQLAGFRLHPGVPVSFLYNVKFTNILYYLQSLASRKVSILKHNSYPQA
jgi:hypothetical protein